LQRLNFIFLWYINIIKRIFDSLELHNFQYKFNVTISQFILILFDRDKINFIFLNIRFLINDNPVIAKLIWKAKNRINLMKILFNLLIILKRQWLSCFVYTVAYAKCCLPCRPAILEDAIPNPAESGARCNFFQNDNVQRCYIIALHLPLQNVINLCK